MSELPLMQSMGQIEDRLASVAEQLPDAECGTSRWGDMCIRHRSRTVATLERHRHGLCLVVKAAKAELPALLASDRYSVAPYVGRYGWVCMRLSSRIDWREVEEMVAMSYELIGQRR